MSRRKFSELVQWPVVKMDMRAEWGGIAPENILELIPAGIATMDRACRILMANSAMLAFLEVDHQALIGRSFREALPDPDPLGAMVSDRLRKHEFGNWSNLEFSRGGSMLHLKVMILKMASPGGEWIGSLLFLRDDSDVKALEEQLRRSDKLAALGTLTAGIAHEIKNPLSALQLNLQLLQDVVRAPLPDHPQANKYLGILTSEIRRLRAIVDRFLDYSRPTTLAAAPIDTRDLLSSTLQLIEEEAALRNVRCQLIVHPGTHLLWGDPDRLRQALLNIVINGIQAMPKGGDLTVEAHRTSPIGSSNGPIEIQIADTGMGIPRTHLGRIFDPYFSTRENGIGLGLFLAHKTIEEHHGVIRVHSQPGERTTFTVILPSASPDQSRDME